MKTTDRAHPNELLSYEREQRHWTQEEVAEKIGCSDAKMVGRWERGITLPNAHYRQELISLFGKSAPELGLVPQGEVPFWHVPYRRNRFFTGREQFIDRLRDSLPFSKPASPTLPLALSGLGGVGKTQLALEYAYRSGHEYHTVAWIPAHSLDVLSTSFAGLASVLHLPAQEADDPEQALQAVKSWLAARTRWLLIFDNVEQISLLEAFLPSPCHGHIILTTRSRITGIAARSLEVDAMSIEEGAYFLLRRAKLVALDASPAAMNEADVAQAQAIATALGGLPLALDQAGAYIEETACGLAAYLNLYQTRRKELLQRRGSITIDHPEPVAMTWSLSFQQLQQQDRAAAALLALLAFLAPDAIAEEIISAGAPDLGEELAPVAADPLLLNQAIKALRSFSLVRRNPETHMLTIHRLVQAVILETLATDDQHMWAERAVRAIARAFPNGEHDTIAQCDRLLTQIAVCEELISRWRMRFPAAALALHRMGNYFANRSLLEPAERILQHALLLREQIHGPEHLEIAETLSALGSMYIYKYLYDKSASCFQRALAIRLKIQGPEHYETGSAVADLAWLYTIIERYEEAVQLYQHALSTIEQHFGTEHKDVAAILNNWAGLYQRQGDYAQAEAMLQRAIDIQVKLLGSDHPYVLMGRHNLAKLYKAQGKYQQAEPLLLRVIAQWEDMFGPVHYNLAIMVLDLANLYNAQGNLEQAEQCYHRALTLYEKTLDPTNAQMGKVLDTITQFYAAQGNTAQAEYFARRAAAIQQQEVKVS